MPVPYLVPPTEIVRRAQDRLLARVSALADASATLTDAAEPPTLTPTARPELPEEQRYVFREALAAGGIGVIRRAEDRRLGRVIAVKELLRASPDAQRRFALEAAITARLQHPGIVPLYDLGWHASGEPFYCMKLVDGESLDAKIQQATTLPQRLRLVEHVIAVADAIAYAHAQKVLHRDLKPANVLVGRFGETVVIDWGLAKDLTAVENEMSDGAGPLDHGTSDMTQAGTVLGTLRYMPPEQAAGEVVDVRSDVYALGAILYHVLAGQPPFAAVTGTGLAAQVLAGHPSDLRGVDPAIPGELATIAHRAMARAPTDRYPDAAAFAEELRRFQAGQMVAAHAYSLRERARLWARSHRVAVAGLRLALAGGVALAWLGYEQARTRAEARAQTEQAEREAAAQADKAERSAFERQAVVDAQRLQASILRAQDMSEETDRTDAARAIARAAAGEALRTGGPIAAASRALAATLMAPRVVMQYGAVDGRYVNHARWAAGGEVVLTLVEGRTLRLWDAGSGQRLVELEGVAGADVAADGALVTAGEDGLVRRDVRSGAITARLGDEQQLIAMSPDRTRIAALAEGELRVRDASTGALIAALPQRAHAAAFSRDNSRIVTGDNGYAWLWSLPDGRKLGDLPTSARMYTALAISGDGERVAVAGNDMDIYMWDVGGAAPKLVKRAVGPTFSPQQLLFTGDGETLISVIMDGAWFAWAPEDGRMIRRVDGEVAHYGAAALSPDERWLALGAGDGTVRVWEVATGALRATLRAAYDDVMSLQFSPDGGQLLAGTAAGPTLVWELPLAVPARWRVARAPVAMDIDVAGDRLAMAGDGVVTVHRVTDGALLAAEATNDVAKLVLSGAGTLLAASPAGAAELWDADTGALRCALPTTLEMWQRPVFLPHAEAVVTVDTESALHLWSTADCRGLHTLRRPNLPYGRIEGTAIGQLVIPGWTTRFELLDPWTRASVQFDGLRSELSGIAGAHDGAQMFAHGSRGDAKVWDARTGEVLAELRGNAARIVSAKYSPDDSAILGLDDSGAARLWRADDLSPSVQLEGRRNWVRRSAVFSPDGSKILIADQRGEVGLWSAHDGAFAGTIARLHGGTPVELAFTADSEDAIVIGAPIGAVRLPATPEGLLAASEPR
ncbi:WD40 repeat domain-containing serine/threonine protein kinase [Nannocystis bainbridge]|uniref:Serine/threonine-protein kinase n=1 Tax=Nannocystis bainbridge TaxID=2995303 RepID=A0ABT5EC62_9BACT|nr:serine/threonine-protein kinase [Nannocystis bainbridge]MDC0723473.1 serine/threonine-protein kinase [Nannocystis bainbridge]